MARKYRGGSTAKQRRRLNPGPLVRTGTTPGREESQTAKPFVGPSDQVEFHRAQQAKGQGRMIPKGMPVEHLLPGNVGVMVGNVTPAQKIPPIRFHHRVHRWPAPSTRTLFYAVPPPNFNIGNGWVI